MTETKGRENWSENWSESICSSTHGFSEIGSEVL